MITEIELENVRIFGGTGWHFSLPPLSVFCGTNNSGKSTILKTLLLLRQSQDIREHGAERQGRLGLVGQQVDLGNYSSLVSHNETHRDILIAITIVDKMPFSLYRFLCLLNNENDNLSSTLVSYRLKSRFIFGISPTSNDEATMISEPVALKKAFYEISINEKNVLSWEVVVSDSGIRNGPKYEMIIPKNLFELVKHKISKQTLLKINQYPLFENEQKPSQEKIRFNTSLKGILPFGMSPKKAQKQLIPVEQPLPPIIREATSDLDKALSDIHYLGPLRSPGKRHYVGAPNIDTDDPTGESIPFLLKERAIYHSTVWNCPPHQPNQPSETILAHALTEWLYYFRTGNAPTQELTDNPEIEVSVKSDLYVEVKIKSVLAPHSYPLIDSGFGYSQVLPILVKGLLVKPGQTLVVEQPELHLNPALQVRLADFIVAMVRTGKQVLIETHSEHIVDAIRVLYVEDETGQLENQCRIFFIDTELDKPNVLPLDIQTDGSVPNWPQHFFGEAASLTGRLLRAQKKFRNKSRIA
ncbi:MAG: AAA family ATPase [Candidatus Parabeggiatoa sp.]|nr:AAA family ATPase [Candidatus Parabeggiatoa sp.]